MVRSSLSALPRSLYTHLSILFPLKEQKHCHRNVSWPQTIPKMRLLLALPKPLAGLGEWRRRKIREGNSKGKGRKEPQTKSLAKALQFARGRR